MNARAALAALAVFAPAGLANAQSIEEGARLFAKACSRCHGPSAREPDLSLRVTYGFATFVRTLRHPPEGMRRFSEKELSQERACSVFLYVRSQRPGALPDPVEVCGLAPAPAPPPPAPSAGGGEPTLPPEPSVAAIDERAFLFGRAGEGAFVLDCWGGDARIRIEPYVGGRWTYEVAVTERTNATRLGSRELLPWQPGQCVRMGEPLASGRDKAGFLLRWRSLDRTPFSTYSLSFPADVTASVFGAGGTQTDMGLLLDALSSPRHRVLLRVTPTRERAGLNRGGIIFDRLEVVDVNGFAIASTP